MEDERKHEEDLTANLAMTACGGCQWEKQDKRYQPCIDCCYDGTHGTMYTPVIKPSGLDFVNHPPHYSGGIECIDVIKLICVERHWQSELSYFIGNIVKYLWRHKQRRS